MIKILFLIILSSALFSFPQNKVLAAPIIDECQTDVDCLPNGRCLRDAAGSLKCSFPSTPKPTPGAIQRSFGTIEPPEALKNFIGKDPTGATGLSRFFTNLVALMYVLAAVVLIFMLMWGAWDWMTSEGDKEKLESAKKKIVNALIGILLFAAAFAIIQVLGQFTGFKFFAGQK